MAWMIYGANGYTGELIAREAVRRGHKPVLAGRTATKVEPLAIELALQGGADLDRQRTRIQPVHRASPRSHARSFESEAFPPDDERRVREVEGISGNATCFRGLILAGLMSPVRANLPPCA